MQSSQARRTGPMVLANASHAYSYLSSTPTLPAPQPVRTTREPELGSDWRSEEIRACILQGGIALSPSCPSALLSSSPPQRVGAPPPPLETPTHPRYREPTPVFYTLLRWRCARPRNRPSEPAPRTLVARPASGAGDAVARRAAERGRGAAGATGASLLARGARSAAAATFGLGYGPESKVCSSRWDRPAPGAVRIVPSEPVAGARPLFYRSATPLSFFLSLPFRPRRARGQGGGGCSCGTHRADAGAGWAKAEMARVVSA
mmetsp:Transcript_1319/g.4903  ORF Transcript_1319/g.4903 Transcript_1319/m.4903 type:complete len:261 (+) Transcript_1319:142-924(+)